MTVTTFPSEAMDVKSCFGRQRAANRYTLLSSSFIVLKANMRRTGIAMFIVGFFMLFGQTQIVLHFMMPLMMLVYPNTEYGNIANGSVIALQITTIFLIIGGVVIILIYRHERITKAPIYIAWLKKWDGFAYLTNRACICGRGHNIVNRFGNSVFLYPI